MCIAVRIIGGNGGRALTCRDQLNSQVKSEIKAACSSAMTQPFTKPLTHACRAKNDPCMHACFDIPT